MAITYESTQIGDVRASTISAAPGVGASLLQFTLVWSLHPKREHTYSVFGTYLRVSVAPEGTTNHLYLGHAWPEVAWTDESRPGMQIDRTFMYQLTLHADQLLALEQLRQAQGLVFKFELRGNSYGPFGIRQVDQSLQMRVSVSDWCRVLRDANAADILLVGVDVPLEPPTSELRTPLQLVRRAHEFLLRGEHDAAVGECRRALESVRKIGKLEEAAVEARKALSGSMSERKSMSKKDRELALAEALINFTHPAHHVGDDGNAEIFGRQDAALTVVTTAALVSSLSRLFR